MPSASARNKNADADVLASPCGGAGGRCELRSDPISLLKRWLWPPPPPRDPAEVLREYKALMASATPQRGAGGTDKE